MGPIDYQSAMPQQDFMKSIQGGLQLGGNIQQAQMQRQQQELAQQRAQQYQVDTQSALASPTPQAFASLALKYPEHVAPVKQAWDQMAEGDRKQEGDTMAQAYSALLSDKPDVAQDVIQRSIDARKNSGLDTSHYDNAMTLVKSDPQKAAGSLGFILSHINDPKTFATQFGALGGEQRALASAPAFLAKAQADARKAGADASVAEGTLPDMIKKADLENKELISKAADRYARLGLDIDTFTTGTKIKIAELRQKFGELPDDARKLVNEGAVTAAGAEQAVAQYADLAQKIDGLGGSWGAGSTAHEFLKRATGSEDAISGLKREYTRMASTGVLKLLPPGPASDKDVALAREGIPNANSSPEVMASYLRGMAKLSSYDAAFNNAKSEWVGAVKHLGTAKTDIEIDGVKVPAGTTFNAFARQFIEKKADQSYNAAITQRRSYMRFAKPTADAPSAQPARAESPVIGD